MIYRCQNCDSALEFDPVSGMMQCLHCGSFFEMSQFADVDVAEKSDAESSSVINSLEDDATMEVKIYYYIILTNKLTDVIVFISVLNQSVLRGEI